MFAFYKSKLGYNPVDIDIVTYILSSIIHSVGRILAINKSTIIKHLKPTVNSIFNAISLIIKIFLTIIKGICK